MDYFRKCPKCGLYLTVEIKPSYGAGWINIWKCSCGYSSEQDWKTTVTTNVSNFVLEEEKKYV